MAVRVKTNNFGDCIYNEDDAIELIYNNPNIDISKLYFEDIEQYTKALKELGINLPKISKVPKRSISGNDFDKANIDNWYMPKEYYELDVKRYLLEKCTDDVEKKRVEDEYELFERKNFVKVLQFLIYFINFIMFFCLGLYIFIAVFLEMLAHHDLDIYHCLYLMYILDMLIG